MKTYAMTDYHGCSYITAGKLYEVVEEYDNDFYVIDDDGDCDCFLWKNCAHVQNHDWQRIEAGTLYELNVNEGDVVECVYEPDGHHIGAKLTINANGWATTGLTSFLPEFDDRFDRKYRIISRASRDEDTPKTWGKMSDAEKGALLLAKHDGKVIESSRNGTGWAMDSNVGYCQSVYFRVKPSPKRETVALCWRKDVNTVKNKIGTIALIDGEPDLDSIKMERV